MNKVIPLIALVAVGAAAWVERQELASLVGGSSTVTAAVKTPAGTSSGQAGDRSRRGGGGPIPVVVARADRKAVPVTVDAVGTVQAIASISIRSRIDSQIDKVHVAEGAHVQEGDVLFTLDSRTLRAQLAQIEAQILKDRAQLEQFRRDLARAEDLLVKHIGTEVQRDTAATAVKAQEAQVAADEANRTNLATSLSYAEIRAPVSGRIGSIATKAGAITRQADTTPLATVNQISPIYVAFAVPQSSFAALRAAMADHPVNVVATTPSGPVSGTVAFIENQIDPATGTVTVKASMPNTDERLWPGAFVPVQVVLDVQPDAVTVPQTAVQLGQDGAYVFVVKDGATAELRPVKVGRTLAGDAVVLRGLSGGESVVVSGQLRLVNGAAVSVQPATAQGTAPADAAPSRS